MTVNAAHRAKAREVGSFWRQGNAAIRRILNNQPRFNILENPRVLLKGCMSYFNWVDNAFHQEEIIDTFKDTHFSTTKSHLRAYTLEGLCAYTGLGIREWNRAMAKRDESDETLAIMDWAIGVIYEQTFTAAAAGLLKENIVMRKLGLADKQESQTQVTTDVEIRQGANEFVQMMQRLAERKAEERDAES